MSANNAIEKLVFALTKSLSRAITHGNNICQMGGLDQNREQFIMLIKNSLKDPMIEAYLKENPSEHQELLDLFEKAKNYKN